MKLHHQEITIKVLVPEGYHISEVLAEQAVIPKLTITLDNFSMYYKTIQDMITARITIKKNIE